MTSVATALAIGAILIVGGGTSITCNQSAADASGLTTALAAISNGQTLCLTNSVDYGIFTGTSKTITIIAQTGTGAPSPINAAIRMDFGAGDSGFTIDGNRTRWDSPTGLSIGNSQMVSGAHDITVKNFSSNPCAGCSGASGRGWSFGIGSGTGSSAAPGPDSNILIQHGHFHDDLAGEATIFIDTDLTSDTGIVFRENLFEHSSADSFHPSANARVSFLNNKIMNSHECLPTCTGNHTDAIQFNSGSGSTIKGNWVVDADQCISGFDGQDSITITHNVVQDCDAHAITLMADSPASTVAWNTMSVNGPGEDNIICGNSAGKPPIASLTNVYNNVYGGLVTTGGGTTCTPTRTDHNVGNGTVTYVGGSDPSTFDSFSDFCLTPASAGYTGADDGGQVGVCGGDYNGTNYGPPSGEGY